MSIPCGLLPTGFVVKPLEDILSEIVAAQLATIDPTLDTSPESVVGLLNGIVASKIREVWELAGEVSDALDPSAATQAQLRALSAITGTLPEAASAGSVLLTLTVKAHSTVPAGAVASVAGQSTNRWVTTADAVNATGADGPIPNVPAVATQTGPLQALAGTLTVIATPQTAWVAVTNPLDAVQGRAIETDAQLRLRRQADLEAAGTSPVDAIRAALDAPANTDILAAVYVQENASGYVDAFGRPPHTVEAVVQFVAGLSGAPLDAARQRVANLLWASKAGGIDTTGAVVGSANDSLGAPHVVRWTEPALVPISVAVTLAVDPAAYAGDAAVVAAVLAFGAALTLGKAVVLAKLEAVIVGVPGVEDVLAIALGTAGLGGAFYAINVGIDPRSLAAFDSSRIAITDVVT